MTPEQVFSIAGQAAMAGWLLLIFGWRTKWAASLVSGAVIPLLLGILYTALVIGHIGESKGGFGSLAAVAELFSNPWVLLAGWVHYLAFDLFVGSWEARDAHANKIPFSIVVPCLVLTFLFGPAGLLLYYGIRYARTRSMAIP